MSQSPNESWDCCILSCRHRAPVLHRPACCMTMHGQYPMLILILILY